MIYAGCMVRAFCFIQCVFSSHVLSICLCSFVWLLFSDIYCLHGLCMLFHKMCILFFLIHFCTCRAASESHTPMDISPTRCTDTPMDISPTRSSDTPMETSPAHSFMEDPDEPSAADSTPRRRRIRCELFFFFFSLPKFYYLFVTISF